MLESVPLWKAIAGAAVVLHGRCDAVSPPTTGRVAVIEVLRGALAAPSIDVAAPAPHPEAPLFFFQPGEEVVVALEGPGAPAAVHAAHFGIWSLSRDRDARLAAVRETCRFLAAGEDDDAAALEPIRALLRREEPFARAAALEILLDVPRARRLLGPPVEEDLARVAADRDPLLRRLATPLLGALPRSEAQLDALLDRLADGDASVRHAANRALVRLTGQDMRFDADGERDRRAIAIARWWRWREAQGTAAG